MSTPESRLEELGLKLPAPTKLPDGLHIPFEFVNVRGDRALFSGHPKNAMDGGLAGPLELSEPKLLRIKRMLRPAKWH